ncbi:M14 family zinc carboxypeptidase [Haloprofundus salilacus]|uniref:M14 family zinc carboxypeptidase n=1 Tax=Haloprofundus salilacus TaxID=2876190 RepID=UPI001CCE9B3C|nr:M14 family zinc carboxypeptidase [Haloprofundus salilacus]
MKRRQFLTSTGLAAAAATLPGVTGATRAKQRDDGYVPDPSAYLTNEQLADELAQLEADSDLIDLRQIGKSAGCSDPLWEVQLGDGDTNVHLITQIHGDEPAGTEAILVVLRQLTTNTDRFADVLDNMSLTIVPRVNPDGAMYARDYDGDGNSERITRRQNTQSWDDDDSRYEPYYHNAENPPEGYDMNRDFNIRTDFDAPEDAEADWWTEIEEEEDGEGEPQWQLDMPYRDNTLKASGLRLTPEVRAVTESFLEADPDYAITHHHQGIPRDPEQRGKEPSVMSVMAAFGPSYLKRAPFYDPKEDQPVADVVNPFIDRETSQRSLRLNTLVADRLAEEGPWDVFDTVTRYGYTTLWGSYLDAMCPQTDAAGMLYEVSGQSDEVGSRAYGLKVEVSRAGFVESFEAMADDPTLDEVNENAYFQIPLAGDEIEDAYPPGTSPDAARAARRTAAKTR